MKLVEISNTKLVLQIQKCKTDFLDVNNNLNELLGIIFVVFSASLVWYQSETFAEFAKTIKIGFIATFVLLTGNFIYVLLNQKQNLYEANLYIFDRYSDSLDIEHTSIWGSKELQRICSLSEVKSVHLEVFSETNPTQLNTSYQVRIEFISGIKRTIEYNSISAFSDSKLQSEFRNLITQTESGVKETLKFLDIVPL